MWLVAVVPLAAWTLGYAETDEMALVGIPLTLLVVGAWAALRPRGANWLAACVATATIWVGAGALAWPTAAGSPGRTWGLLLITGGIAILARTTMLIRRPLPTPAT